MGARLTKGTEWCSKYVSVRLKNSASAKCLKFKCLLYGVMMIQAKKVDEGIRESSTEAILHCQISGPANLSLRLEIGAGGAYSHT